MIFKPVYPLPQLSNIHIVAKSRFFEVQSVDLTFSNGTKRTFERLTPKRTGGAVMALAIENDHLFMIREYAVASERYELTFPKGLIDKGETPEQSVNRELQEEIGMGARKITPLRVLYHSPTRQFSFMHVFIMEDLYPSKLAGDEPEPLETVRIPLSQIDSLITHPEFADAINLLALFLLREHLLQPTAPHEI